MKITLKQLRQAKACQKQAELFQQLFGDEVTVTEALCLAHAGQFDWDWAAEHLLTEEQEARYQRETAEAEARLERETDEPWARYRREIAESWARYRRETAEPRARYEREIAELRARYRREQAAIFGKICENI